MKTSKKTVNNKSKAVDIKDENPNKPLTPDQKRILKKKQIIGIVITSILLAIVIVLTVLVFTVFFKK